MEALARLLSVPAADVFAPEVVAVPTRGVERWVTQQLSEHLGARPGRSDGICARIEMPSVRRLTDDAVVAALGVDPEEDPWRPERTVWPLLEVADAALQEPWLQVLSRHVAGEQGRARRFGTVRHIATLFDRYALERPAMVEAWRAGRDVDAAGRALRADRTWQAELWRRLRVRIGAPAPAERLAAAVEALGNDPAVAGLPERLFLLGVTRLPAAHLAVLRALARDRDVHLLVLHPSPALWSAVGGGHSVGLREEDATAGVARNRLLASWGRDVRELQTVIGAVDADDVVERAVRPDGTLLARLQAQIAADGEPAGRPPLAPGDRSVVVHSCHGRGRQVEVLRDAILHALAEDPTLEPRDVIVMCPDIEAFAPLVQATFGTSPASADGQLRVRLADRALTQTNPLLGVVEALLALADARITATQVLDLADSAPVRRRFALTDDDLARAEEWIASSGIRWGLSAAQRAPFRLERVAANTWQAGLERILLGVAMTEEGERLVGGVLPLDDVGSSDIDLAGRLAELLDRLGTAVEAFAGAQPVSAWAQAIGEAADALTAASAADQWQRAELDRLLAAVEQDAAATGAAAAELSLPEVRTLLTPLLAGRPTRASFRTGHLTVCTLMPMRSVPHRVICLLGLDDGVFPRKKPRDGDDLLLDAPMVGDHDGRTEDRQLLLDALMAATDRLIVTFSGHDERTNAPLPPAVPVGELLDEIDRTAADGRAHVVVSHPLQPFDARNFEAAALGSDGPWSHDATMLDGAQARAHRAGDPAGPWLGTPLADRGGVVELDALMRFVEFPVRAFLRERLGVFLGARSDEVADGLPVELDGLQKWGAGDRMLQARLRGASTEAAEAAERARGTLPPGELAEKPLRDLVADVEAIFAAAGTHVQPGAIDVRVGLSGGRVLSGTVRGLEGATLRTTTFSRVGPKHRLVAWVRLLALTAFAPEREWTARTVGRRRGGGRGVSVALLPPLPGDPAARGARATAELSRLVDLYESGMREPAPLYEKTSAAWAQAALAGRDAPAAATKEWETTFGFEREDASPEHELVLGGRVRLGALLKEPPRAGEPSAAAEPSRMGQWALALWNGLLAHEQIRER